jgi:hypothetical protein
MNKVQKKIDEAQAELPVGSDDEQEAQDAAVVTANLSALLLKVRGLIAKVQILILVASASSSLYRSVNLHKQSASSDNAAKTVSPLFWSFSPIAKCGGVLGMGSSADCSS